MNNWQARYGQEHSYQESGLESLADSSPPGGKKCTCFKSKSLDIIGDNRITLGGKNPLLLILILAPFVRTGNGGVRSNENNIRTKGLQDCKRNDSAYCRSNGSLCRVRSSQPLN